MQAPAFPVDERERVATLHALNILDTEPEERFDRLTRIAQRMFNVPMAQVSLIDSSRQWIKSAAGLQAQETPRSASFCGHTILTDAIMHVEDAQQDERFHDNPLVTGDPNIRFYAGCPLQVNNRRLGALCLIANEPRTFSEDEERLLRDLAGMVEQELAAMHMATTDELTQLVNRRGFEIYARQALGLCRRQKLPATLVYFDLNDFKQINDRFGHAEGDRCLRTFADCLRDVFRESDVLARLGGDEFVVLLTNTAPEDADAVIARMREWIATKNEQERRGYALCFSTGRVGFDAVEDRGIDELLREADEAMYREKVESKRGRGNA